VPRAVRAGRLARRRRGAAGHRRVTGELAPFGIAQQRGVERALAEVDGRGGLEVAGERRPVRLLVRDTRSQPDVAGQEALVLVRGPFDLLGLLGPCSPPVAMVRVAESREVPLVTGCQPLPPVGPVPLRHTWEVAPSEAERAREVLRALRTSPGRQVGLFLSNDRSAAPWLSAAVQAGYGAPGTYRPQGRDWSAAVRQAAQDGVQVVVAVTQAPEGIGLWLELARQGVRPRTAYASEAGLGSAWQAVVGQRADDVLTDLVHPLEGPATPQQVDEAVTAVSAELTRVLLDGLARARATTRTELAAALTGATARVAGTDVRFGGDRASRPPVRLGRWKGGRLHPVR